MTALAHLLDRWARRALLAAPSAVAAAGWWLGAGAPWLRAAAALPLALELYAWQVEPRWLRVRRLRVSSPDARRTVRLALLTDLHVGQGFPPLGHARAKLRAFAPDVVLLGGDLASEKARGRGVREEIAALARIAPTVVVPGNWERWLDFDLGAETDGLDGVHVLVNQRFRLEHDGQALEVVGLDDHRSSTPRWPDGRGGPAVRALLTHSPSYFDAAGAPPERCDLAVAGHTHGRQVRIPGLRPRILPRGCGSFVDGLYERNGLPIYVSRGIGLSVMPLRFACRPEVVLIEVVPGGAP